MFTGKSIIVVFLFYTTSIFAESYFNYHQQLIPKDCAKRVPVRVVSSDKAKTFSVTITHEITSMEKRLDLLTNKIQKINALKEKYTSWF